MRSRPFLQGDMAIFWSVQVHRELQSTQTHLRDLVRAGQVQEGFAVQALHQSAGHGRYGRPWVFLPGNLALSFVLRPSCPSARYGELSLMCGVALARALEGYDIQLKWPNDVLLSGRKCAGILLETEEDYILVGLGLNIASAPEGAAALGSNENPVIWRERILSAVGAVYKIWKEIGFEPIRAEWLEKSVPVGMEISVTTPRETLRGQFLGLDSAGNLLVSGADGTGTRMVAAGEVQMGEALAHAVGH